MKALKKAWIFLLLVSLAALFSTTALADEPDYDSEGFYTDGETTYYQPIAQNTEGVYEIGNAGQLFWFAALVNGETEQEGITTSVSDADAVLTANIDLNPGHTFDEDGSYTTDETADVLRAWEPIWNKGNSGGYSGSFDGQGYTISGIYINETVEIEGNYAFEGYYGLFGYISGGTVKNIVLKNSSICVSADENMSYYTSIYIASIAGYVINNGEIRNCQISSVVRAIASSDAVSYAGGLVGRMASGVISDCENSGSVYATTENHSATAFAGGIVGYVFSGEVNNCENNGVVSAFSSAGNSHAGGIVSYMYNSTINNCANDGKITSTAPSRSGCVGGIVSYGIGGTVSDCKNSGSISASGYDAYAGAVGQTAGSELYNITNRSAVNATADDNAYAGGIVGEVTNSTFNNCENSGAVSAEGAAELWGYAHAGGIAGAVSGSITVSNCKNSGTVNAVKSNGDAYASGIIDYVSSDSIVTDCENSGNVCALSSGSYAGGITRKVSGSVSNCANSGVVSATPSDADGWNYAGGITGYADETSTVTKCSNSGNISATGTCAFVGGVVGYMRGTVSRCANSGTVNSTVDNYSNAYTGGIVGYMYYGTLSNSYNTGMVTATAITGSDAYAGGILGYADVTNDKTVTVISCYSVGTVVASTTTTSSSAYADVADSSAFQNDRNVISNCYYLEGTIVTNTASDKTDSATFDSEEITEEVAGGTDEPDTQDIGITVLTATQFADGTALSLLNGGVTDGTEVWIQNIGIDPYPLLATDTENESIFTPGDLNGDGEVDASDLTVLARHVGKVETMEDETALANADVTGDGNVDASDLTKLAQYVGKIISSLD
ncbi:MAG: dockerin type I repeat-containing protein [Oscillospiraceae bacterium]|nr:dockerin type I repeat-containing protein [Oscillospiraceae bacterium]